MRKCTLLLFLLFSLFAVSPAFAEVWPYQVVDIKKNRLARGGELIKLIITTVERDMSKISGKDLAETVECAYQYVRRSPAGAQARQINVLLFDTRDLHGNCLARAALDMNGRVLESISGNGPTKRQIRVCEAIGELQGNYARVTTDEDYAQVARSLKMKKSAVKKAHFDAAILSSNRVDRSELIDSVPGLTPVFPNK